MVKRLLFVLLAVPLLISCRSDNPAITAESPAGESSLSQQSIEFTDIGPVYVVYGDAGFTNLAAGGGGTGSIR